MPSTALLALPYPASTDADDVPLHMQNLATAVEVIFADQGALSALPSTPSRGRRYFATDKGVELRGDGTSWTSVGLSKAGGDTVLASGAGVVPLTLKLASGQTANALEVRNNANALIASIDPAGGTTVGGALSSGAHTVTSPAAGTVGLAVVLAPSPTANAVEVRSSAAVVLASVSAAGAIAGSSAAIAGPVVTSPSAAQVGLKVQLAASASGKALEVRDSSNTLMAFIDASGAVSAPSAAISGQLTAGSAVASPGLSQVGVRVQLPASATLAALDVRSSTNALLAQIGAEGAVYGSTNNGAGFGGLFDGTVSGSTGLMGRAMHAGAHGVIARAAASQTATIFEVQTSAGAALVSIGSQGTISTVKDLVADGASYLGGNATFFTATLNIKPIANDPSVRGIVIRNAPSQSANAFEVQDSSGAVLASIGATGKVSASSGLFVQGRTGDNSIFVIHTEPAQVAQIIRLASGQSAAAWQIQNSGGGSTLAQFSATGALSAANVTSAGDMLVTAGGLKINTTATAGHTAEINAFNSGHRALTLRGQSGQSVNLLEVQNSASGLISAIDSLGALYMASRGGTPGAPGTGNGYLYVDAGALKYKGGNNTVTQLAAA